LGSSPSSVLAMREHLISSAMTSDFRLGVNSEYRIEKGRVAVTVTMLSGEELAGQFFVQMYAPHRLGPETPADIMNAPEAFVPLGTADRGTLLLAKKQVREVRFDAPDDATGEARSLGARVVEIELALVDGTLRTGAIALEVAHDRPRLLDFLNRFHLGFLTLHTPDGVRLINRRMIERVRQLD
jgi:hypothetical protein